MIAKLFLVNWVRNGVDKGKSRGNGGKLMVL